MTNKDLFEALRMMEAEKGIKMDYMLEQIEKAIVIACKNYYAGNDAVEFKADSEKNTFDVKLKKTIVDDVFDPDFEISLEDAQKALKRKKLEIGDEVMIPLDPKQLGRISVAAARNVIRQGIRDCEKGQTLVEFQSKLNEIVTAQVERIDPKSGTATIKIGKSVASLPKSEQIGYPNLKEGDLIKVFIADVKEGDRGPRAIISRSSPLLVKRLFEQEVPEIYDGVVEIKSVSREAGSRTKIAVKSNNPDVDAVGACIGSKSSRVNKIVDELGGEKIDIVVFSEEIEKFISASLSPAEVCSVSILDRDARSCRVTVPDGQLSLAIGNKGQNARLAARLTGWKIDIRPESGFYGEDDDKDLVEKTEDTTEETKENETLDIE